MYFITGLPRSRTGWLAAYLSLPGNLCAHELVDACASPEEFHYQAARFAGVSDSGLCVTDFLAFWPDAPVVMVRRPKAQVKQSMFAAGLLSVSGLPVPDALHATHLLLTEVDRRLDLMRGERTLEVEYDLLDIMLPAVCKHVGVMYDATRHQVFESLNIQLNSFDFKGLGRCWPKLL